MSKENKKQHKCCVCGHVEYSKGQNPVWYAVNPYRSEIHDDKTKNWYCRKCYWDLADEI